MSRTVAVPAGGLRTRSLRNRVTITVLAFLALSTAQADLRLAERYAATVTEQYARELQGQRFLREAEEWTAAGNSIATLPDVESDGNTVTKTITEGSGSLVITLFEEDGEVRVSGWKTLPLREEDTGMGNLWSGS